LLDSLSTISILVLTEKKVLVTEETLKFFQRNKW